MLIVDTHQHLWDLSKLKLPWLADAPEVLRKTYRNEEYRQATEGLNVVDATIDEVLYLGPDIKYQLALASGQRVSVREPRETDGRELQRGDRVRIGWRVGDGLLVGDPGSG